ncbi:PIR Superfamily Protein, partial [Plasmodium malariae]
GNILKKLPSYKIYSEFNSDKNINNNSICKEEDYRKCDNKDACINLCKKIERNFKNLYELRKSEDYKMRCSHHMYWVNEEIRNLLKLSSNHNIKDVVNKFLSLGTYLTTDYRIYNCNYFVHESLEKLKNRRKEKYLYDYFTNYNTIKNKDICTDANINSYKYYINFISKIYDDKKESCCSNEISFCPHYFLECGDEYNPSNVLSALQSTGKESCDGLERLKETKIVDKELHSTVFEKDFLDSILFTTCHINKESTHLPCGFVSASFLKHRKVTAVENSEQENSRRSASEGQQEKFTIDADALKQHLEIRNKVGLISSEENKILSYLQKTTNVDLRWTLRKDGTLRCPSEIPENDTLELCTYIEQLVEKGILVKLNNTNGYRLAEGKSWPTEEFEIVIKRESQRKSMESSSQKFRSSRIEQVLKDNQESTYVINNFHEKAVPTMNKESNILYNTFFRVTMAISLVTGIIFVLFLYFKFTSYGLCKGKNRKRKKRYRSSFAELNGQRSPRKFIKRTYRHSDRRRFSVVNIEQ